MGCYCVFVVQECQEVLPREVLPCSDPLIHGASPPMITSRGYLRSVAQVSCRRSGWCFQKAWQLRVGTRAKARCSVMGVC